MVAAKGKVQPPTGEVEGGSKEEKASANDEKAPNSKKRKFEAPAGGGRGGGSSSGGRGGGAGGGGRGFFPNRGKSAGDRDVNNYTAVNALKRIKLKVYISTCSSSSHVRMYVCMYAQRSS